MIKILANNPLFALLIFISGTPLWIVLLSGFIDPKAPLSAYLMLGLGIIGARAYIDEKTTLTGFYSNLLINLAKPLSGIFVFFYFLISFLIFLVLLSAEKPGEALIFASIALGFYVLAKTSFKEMETRKRWKILVPRKKNDFFIRLLETLIWFMVLSYQIPEDLRAALIFSLVILMSNRFKNRYEEIL